MGGQLSSAPPREKGESRDGVLPAYSAGAALPSFPGAPQERACAGTHLHCSGATGAPEQWKCTFCHLPSRRCHTRVSSDWLVRGRPCPSMYCVRRM